MISDNRIEEICNAVLDGTYAVDDILGERHTVVGIVEVINGNPNGDPAADNVPRTDIVDGHGIISNMCIKRKSRDTIKVRHGDKPGYELYCERGSNVKNLQDSIRTNVKSIFDAVCKSRGMSTKETNEAWSAKKHDYQKDILLAVVSESFVDVRMFGCVLSSLVREGSANIPVQVKGPTQVCDAKSFDVVAIDQRTISVTFGNKDDLDRNFAAKSVVPYGLYMFHADVSPIVARNTHMTNADMSVFLDSLKWMFELDQSASRGEQNLIALWDFKHGGDEAAFGAQPRRELLKSIRVRKLCDGIPTCLDDYDISFDESVLCDEVSVTRLV